MNCQQSLQFAMLTIKIGQKITRYLINLIGEAIQSISALKILKTMQLESFDIKFAQANNHLVQAK